MSGSIDEDDDDDDAAHGVPVPEGSWPVVRSLWGGNQNMSAGRWGTRVAGASNTAANIGAGVAQHAGFAGIAGHVGLGAAAGALTAGTGGPALVVGAGVLQIGSMIAAARSVSKTWDHLEHLGQIQAKRHYACTALKGAHGGQSDHHHIHANVIPYIVNKKSAKLVKKGAAAIGAGALTGLFGIGKNLYKRARGTLGRRRTFYAFIVARHTITHDCKLREALVGELFDHEIYERLKTMNSEDAGGWIARKMKSN